MDATPMETSGGIPTPHHFCWAFYPRSDHSTYPQAKRRRVVYLLCAIAMVLAILALG